MRAKEFIYERSLKQRVADEDYDPNGPPPGPEFKPTMPKGTVKVDVSDVYDWYKLGQHISNLKGLGKHDFGSGPPSTIMAFGDEDTEHKYINDLEKTGLTTTDIDPVDPHQPKGVKRQKVDPTYNVNEYDESVSDPKKDPEAYYAYLKNHLKFIMGFFDRAIKPNSWKPSEKEMMDAIDIAYEVMKKTRDVKVAGKAFQDHLKKLHKKIEIFNHLKQMPLTVFGSTVTKSFQDANDFDVFLDLDQNPDHKKFVRPLLILAKKYYGWIDPFVLKDKLLYVRNDESTGWIRAKNAAGILRQIREHGKSIDDIHLQDQQGVSEGSDSNLSYQGNCTEDDVIEHIFGDVNNFARMVEEHGDEFTVGDLVVKYDPEEDIHSFYYKKQEIAEDTSNISQSVSPKINIQSHRVGNTMWIDYFEVKPRNQGFGTKAYMQWEKNLPSDIKTVRLVASDAGEGPSHEFWDRVGFDYAYDDDGPMEMVKTVESQGVAEDKSL